VSAAPVSPRSEATGVAPRTAKALAQTDFCDDAEVGCEPTGAHGKLAVNFATGHAGYECKECHYIGGRLAFKPGGLAFLPAPSPRPYFNADTNTCSNIACHYVKPGTFTYSFPGGDGEPVQNTVPYGGGTPQPTPDWYATGASCGACHRSPPYAPSPPYDANQPYTWHSGYHGGFLADNNCQFCHPDAVGTFTGFSTSIPPQPVWVGLGLSTATNCGPARNQPCAALHANGGLNVQATFSSRCFGCH
jgi:hypothetical protein